jgi:hypothetical protein
MVQYPGGMRHEDGEVIMIAATGTLTVEVQGDSLVATLVQNPSDQLPTRGPLRMATTRGANATEFVTRANAQVNIHGAVRQATSVSTWTLTATGETLNGTLARRIEGIDDVELPATDPQPVSGTRAR